MAGRVTESVKSWMAVKSRNEMYASYEELFNNVAGRAERKAANKNEGANK